MVQRVLFDRELGKGVTHESVLELQGWDWGGNWDSPVKSPSSKIKSPSK